MHTAPLRTYITTPYDTVRRR